MANDHYVPQFYLRRFAIETKPGFVYSYIRNGKLTPRPISRVASAEGFYDVRWDTNPRLDPDSLDRVYSLNESGTAPILDRLVTADGFTLSDAEREMLAWFVALLVGRTPLTRERYKNIQVEFNKRLIKSVARDKEHYREIMREHDPNADPEETEAARLATAEGDLDELFRFEFGEDGETDFKIKGFGMVIVRPLAETLFQRRWHLVESTSVRRFATSDNPVVLMPPPGARDGSGWGYDNSPVLIPLSPRRALLIDDQLRSEGIIKVGREMMAEFIFYVVNQAYEFVYSSEASTELKQMFDKTEAMSLTAIHLPDADHAHTRRT